MSTLSQNLRLSARAPLAAFLALLLGATCIGFSGVFVRFSDVGPAAIGLWRMLLALPFLMLWARLEAPRGQPAALGSMPRGAWIAMVLAGATFCADMVLFHAALDFTSVAKASLLGNAGPLFVVAIAWLVYGHRPSRGTMAALGVALVGAVLLLKPERMTDPVNIGDVMGLGAALFYGLYLVLIQQVRARYQAGLVGVVTSVACAGFCLLSAWALGEAILPQSLEGWLPLIALGLVSHALGQGLITLAIGKVSSGVAAVVLIYPALVSTLAAWAVFGEVPTPVQIAGGVLVLGALLMARR